LSDVGADVVWVVWGVWVGLVGITDRDGLAAPNEFEVSGYGEGLACNVDVGDDIDASVGSGPQ